MLRLENITKVYASKDMEVHALKGISLAFRKSEFVSILGPSGCGKTTLLNILGGLDHYTSGDLFIEGISTKDYDDHDWDIYRNHRIGFIFQSYNLIPHENILENVELALTIAGVSKEEREQKAKAALDRVGLQDMYKKMPNQLSGGQCQRVAIARALVNEPDILLADEPTGALDSTTSVQIMDLIREISKEKLVIMVTHNPEIAEKYSTRIVRLLDGKIEADSLPYDLEEEKKEAVAETHNSEIEEKAKMSWWTAFKLSAKNLWSKVKRTSMIVVAAAIGIVGVSAVLSVSNGVTGYIDGMQDEMLSGNPVTVSARAFDLASIMSNTSSVQQQQYVQEATKDGYINIDFLTKRLIDSAKAMGTSMIENNLDENYVNYIDQMDPSYYRDIVKSYGIDIANNIYTDDVINGQGDIKEFSLSSITNFAISILKTKLAETGYSSYASMISSYTNTFAQSINSTDYLLEQYDVVRGKIATEENEVMVVLNSREEITDFTLVLLGYLSQDDFLNIVYKYNVDENGKPDPKYDEERYEKTKQIAIEKLMSKKFTYYPNDTVFTSTTATNRPFIYDYHPDPSWDTGMDLKVVGILKPKEGRQYASLYQGFFYTPKFADRFIRDNIGSELCTFIREYDKKQQEEGKSTGYTSSIINSGSTSIANGIYYRYDYEVEGEMYFDNIALVGSSDDLSNLLSQMAGGDNSLTVATLTQNHTGGRDIPTKISFYPNSFATKNLVTDYLNRWNSKDTLTVNGVELAAEDRQEITYTDNLQVVISMINNVINIVTIALISFTALALVVSTVMVSIITYVSVMERIKEIGVIRALGGRKKDVSHLFNAETMLIGFASGVFGLTVTYIIQILLNFFIHLNFPMIGTIANLSWLSAIVILTISIILTVIAGLIPARSAAKKDPVEALRTE